MRARRGEGPTLIEMMSYRWQGHFSGDLAPRPTDLMENRSLERKDPLKIAKQRLQEDKTNLAMLKLKRFLKSRSRNSWYVKLY